MEEKKLVPKRRFEGFEGDWYKNKLKNLASFSKGRGYSKNDIKNRGTELLLYGSLYTSYQTIVDKVNVYTKKKPNSVLSNGEEVVVPSSGETKEDIARASAIVKSGIIIGGDLNIIQPTGELNSVFLALEISNGSSQKGLIRRAQGSSVVHLYNDDLKSVVIYYPDLKEQQKIGKFFRVLDDRIANQERKIAKVKALKEAYLSEMFPQEGETVPKRRFKGFKGEWRKTSLGELGYTYSGMSGKTKKDFGHGEAEFITYLNVFNNPISKETGLKKVVLDTKEITLKYGDILFTTSSETPHEVGMSSVWLFNKENVYLNSFCFGFRPSIKIDSYFIAFFLRTNRFRKRITVLAQGISRYNISKNKVMDIEILLPNIKEQQKIGAFFKNLDDQIEAEEAKLEKLKQMKEAYLEEMFV